LRVILKTSPSYPVVPLRTSPYSLKFMRKQFFKIVWIIANAITRPYIYIETSEGKEAKNMIKTRFLKAAIHLYKFHYKNMKNNGDLFFIGKSYQALDDHSKALEYFKKVWETAAYSPVCFKEIGTECLILENYEEALSFALKEVSQFPGQAESRAHLALVLTYLKRVDAAYEEIQRARSMGESPYVMNIFNLISDIKSGKKPIPERLGTGGKLP